MPKRVSLEMIGADELAGLGRLDRKQMTFDQYKAEYRRSYDVTRRLLDEFRAQEQPEPEPVLPDLDEDDDPYKAWRTLETYQHHTNKREEIPWDHHIDLNTDKPTLIAWVADMHIGHSRSNLRKIRHALETIRETDGMYVIFGGDDGENTTSSRAHHGAHHERLMTTKTERKFVELALTMPERDEHGNWKVLGVGEGNHTGRSIQDDGDSWLQRICEKHGLHYYGYRQRLHVKVGRWEYRIICAHKHRGGGLDATRPAKKLMEEWGDADQVFTAHIHRIAISQEYVRLEPRGFGVAGSFKDRDDFSGSRGYTPSLPIMPGILLYPKERYFIQFFDVFNPKTLRILASERAAHEAA